MPDAAIIAALTIRSSGIASWVLSPSSIVRQGRSPQTLQHWLAPTRAPSHSSKGLPAIQMRLDSDGSARKAASSMASGSSTGSMPSGRNAASSLLRAPTTFCCVEPQRGQVSPSLTRRFQRMGRGVMTFSERGFDAPAAPQAASHCLISACVGMRPLLTSLSLTTSPGVDIRS
jgi:hypothetical protein